MSCFSNTFSSSKEYEKISYNVQNNLFPLGVLGLPPTPKALLIHTVLEQTKEKAVVLTADDASAEKMSIDLCALGTNAVFYPSRDYNFYNVTTSSKEYEQKRIGALTKILSEKRCVLVLSAEAALQKIMPPEELKNRIFKITDTQEISVSEIKEKLVKCGYQAADMVEGPGQFSHRGGILDIFPANLDKPVRIEFWGDEIDSISFFDIMSQRREDTTKSVSFSPVSEVLFDNPSEIAKRLNDIAKASRSKNTEALRARLIKDSELLCCGILPGCSDKYLPAVFDRLVSPLEYFKGQLLFVCDTFNIKGAADAQDKLHTEEIKDLFSSGELCKGLDDFYSSFEELTYYYTACRTVYADNFARGSFDTPVKDLINYNISQISVWNGSAELLIEDTESPLKNGYTVIAFAGTRKSAEALEKELKKAGVDCALFLKLPKEFIKGKINIVQSALTNGLDYPAQRLLVVSYGKHARSSRPQVKKHKKNVNAFNSIEELQTGDYVVHRDYGIGIFSGIEQVKIEGKKHDYIRIRYAKNEQLLISITNLDVLSKYIGPRDDDGASPVKLNSLNNSDWEKTKSRVRKAVADVAAELIKIYAQRKGTVGHAFASDVDLQSEFEQKFEFDETDDQLKCIEEIKSDMEMSCPMDRLLCGDVGFGKTEVALRAAFKCICEGKQAAILVPTTILAMQHYKTILHRFEGFPIEAEMLCRFRTPKQQKAILEGLKKGSVDIIAGTHRLISKDVEFKDLGLLIIDEEQRFGVMQKEKIKEMFPTVDVLTLSATPIPRTLNFALSGIRDLSVIEEAPMDRHPVQTYVMEHDMGVISQAIAKELRRGGQVYYLHNKVSTIEDKATELRELFPDAIIETAHGKMTEKELSDIWKRLTEGDVDILVCTTIIETGVDVPNANTMIIEDADRFGLSQLHQLRGRVGRSTRRASTYCTFRKNSQLSEIAERRLSAIREFTQFGSGFKIAMRDMEIRGAGNLLGAQQHGHLEAVGYDMYMKLLNDAVTKLTSSGEIKPPPPVCKIEISMDAYIPDTYISNYNQRLSIYKKISNIATEEDYSDILDELIDRYGEPPKCVLGLLRVPLIRIQAAASGFTKIKQEKNALLFYTKSLSTDFLSRLAVGYNGNISTSNTGVPYYKVSFTGNPSDAILKVINLLK